MGSTIIFGNLSQFAQINLQVLRAHRAIDVILWFKSQILGRVNEIF